MNVYSQLVRAQLEVKTSDHVGTIPGMVWFHNTEKRVKFSEGTLVVPLLANDGKAVFGTNGTANTNVRFHRSAAETLQIVPGGNTTAEGTDATLIGQISAKQQNFTDGTRPAFGNVGRVIYNTTSGRLEIDTGVAWDPVAEASTGVGIEAVEQAFYGRKAGIATPGYDNCVGSGFETAAPYIELFLLRDLAASSTSAVWAPNPKFLEDANRNSNFVAYTAVTGTDAANVNTIATFLIGSSAVSWDKSAGTSTSSFIQYDLGSAAIGLTGHQTVLFYANLPSITQLSTVSIRMSAAAPPITTDYRQINYSLQYDGTSITTGWNLFGGRLTAGSATGAGWSVATQLLRVFSVGVVTTAGAQTYTDIIGPESLVFVEDAGQSTHPSYARAVNLGSQYEIVNTSNRETIILSAASVRVIGNVTLAAGTANTYTGGTSSVAMRSTMGLSGNLRGEFQSTSPYLGFSLSSGAVGLTQSYRTSKILKDTLSAATVTGVVSFYSELNFYVTNDALSATTIALEAPVDISAQLLSGDVLHICEADDRDGGLSFPWTENDFTLTANSSWSGGTLTLTGSSGDVTNVDNGDLLIKANTVKGYISSVATATTNESFGSALTRTAVIVTDVGLPYIKPSNLFGHFFKLTPTQATSTFAATNRRGTYGAPLVVVGTGASAYTREFKNGQLAAGGFSDSNYFTIGTVLADSAALNPDTGGVGLVSLSFWFYVTATTPAAANCYFSREDGVNGWFVFLDTSRQLNLSFLGGSGVVATSTPVAINTWHFGTVVMQDGGSSYIKVDGVKTSASGNTITASSSGALNIGRRGGAGGVPAADSYLADVEFWSAYALTDADEQSMRNGGRHVVLGTFPEVKYRYLTQSNSGQKLSFLVELLRRSNAVAPQIQIALAAEAG